MRRTLGCLLALALALPAHALASGNDKKEDKKKDAKKKGPTAEEVLALADQKVASGDLAGALDIVREAASFDSAPGEVTLRLGVLRELNHELDVAIETYKAASEKLAGPAKGEALGRMSVVQDVFVSAEATAAAEAAVAADPGGVWPTIALSRSRARGKKGDEAAALAQKAVAAGGGAPASAALGFAEETRADLAAAEVAYRAAIAAEPGRVDSSVGLARVLRRTGRPAEADPLLQEVIKVAPGAIEAYKESARVKMALGRPEAAKGDAATAAVLAEGDAEAQLLVQQVTVAAALGYLPTGQVDTAIRELTALRDKDPNFVDARVGLAKALLAKRQDDAAVVELQKAIELAPENAEAHFQLGYVNHAAKRNAAKALASYEKAVALDPANIEYRTNLGAVLAELNQYDRAVAELTKVTASPGYASAAAWIYLGGAHLAAKKYKEASAALEKAIAIAPDEVMGQAYMAWSCLGLKDAASFKKYGAKARSLGYKDPTFLERLGKVEAGEAIK